MSLIVQKFGGSSVKDAQRIENVAERVAETYLAGNDVIVVLSAQGDTTDDLIAKAAEINPKASKREMDMLLATGEQISVALCAMAVEALGFPVVSLTGWQAGMVTNTVSMNARIKKVDTERIEAELDAKRPTALYIRNIRNRATFSLGKKNPEMNGKIYQCRKADASVLYDRIDGEWKTQEMDDREMQITGKK